MKFFLKILLTCVIFGATFLGVMEYYVLPSVNERVDQEIEQFGADNTKFVTGRIYRLSGSGISSSATTITLTEFKDRSGNIKLSMSDHIGDIGYLTLEPNNPSKTELISFTGITQNADGSADLTGVTRGLEFVSPYTASTTLQQSHSGGSLAVISDPPQFFDQITFKDNDETVTGIWDFSSTSPPRYDFVPLNHNNALVVSTTSEFASIAYVNNVATSGAATADTTTKGLVEIATAAEVGSSTATGGSGASLIIPASIATDTPQNCSGTSCVVVANLVGKIKQTWLNLTEAFTWTGLHTFNATSTHSGINISGVASTTNSTTLQVNGLDAFGTITGIDKSDISASFASFVTATTTDESINDTETETTIGTGDLASVPAGALGTNGGLRVVVNISTYTDSGDADTATVRFKLGGTTACSVTLNGAPASNKGARVEFLLYNDNSASSQQCIASGESADDINTNDSTSSIDTSGALVPSVTWQWSTLDGGETENATVSSIFITNLGD